MIYKIVTNQPFIIHDRLKTTILGSFIDLKIKKNG